MIMKMLVTRKGFNAFMIFIYVAFKLRTVL
jgi:hypothetical protein